MKTTTRFLTFAFLMLFVTLINVKASTSFLYLVKTSDKVGELTYMLNTATAPKIYSLLGDGKFEGYADLSTTNWDNIGLVHQNQLQWDDLNGGWWPEQSSGSFTLQPNYFPATPGRFISQGPWANWNWTNNNTNIVSSGYWKINYDSITGKLDLIETQWAVKGSATGNVAVPLSYNPTTKKWSAKINLSAGSFNFVTIPVVVADPIVTYGVSTGTSLSESGNNIVVSNQATYSVELDLSNALNYTYSLSPSFLYLVKSSDKVGDLTYMLNTATAPKIYSPLDDGNFEGYVDLSTTNWDNIGLVNPNLIEWYDVNGGWWPQQSSGTFTLQTNYFPETPGRFISWGPWADWKWTNSNTSIVSPGYWKINYNSVTGQLDLLETQWAVKGTATGNVAVPLSYNPTTKKWSANVNLSSGNFKFVSVPVVEGDPVVTYGVSSGSSLTETGADIAVSNQGAYLVELDLSNALNYSYNFNAAYLYLIKSSDKVGDLTYMLNTQTAQQLVSTKNDGNFEGYIDLTATDWDNIGLVNPNQQEWYDVNGGWWPQQSSGSFTLQTNYFPETPGRFISWGPWADWKWTNNNASIVSPGYWKFNYSISTQELNLVETQWAIKGSATGDIALPMTYSTSSKKWSIKENLVAGNFKFVTIPVVVTDPVISYGSSNGNNLAETGAEIAVSANGTYDVILDLKTPLNYNYSATLNIETAVNITDSQSVKLVVSAGVINAIFEGTSQVQLYNVSGVLINSEIANRSYTIKVNKGIYFLRIKNQTIKIIVS